MTLEVELRKRATQWARQITQKAHRNLGKYRKLITVQSRTESRNGKISVRAEARSTAVSEYGDVKNVVRAYEDGSGIHARGKGRRGKYIIAPRRKKVLAFHWDTVNPSTPKGKKFRGISSSGKAIFNYVEHPGVQAANGGRGYLRPAIAEVRRNIRKEIGKDIETALIGSFKRVLSKK